MDRQVNSRCQERLPKITDLEDAESQGGIAFLGHIVPNEGILVDSQKIEAVKNWPKPTSLNDIRSFLVLSNNYRSLLNYYCLSMKSLNEKRWKSGKDPRYPNKNEILRKQGGSPKLTRTASGFNEAPVDDPDVMYPHHETMQAK
ncbi:hypothetical protein MTR67_044616 [Solanum verrucosum]|uniref:Uncharacterized protein n=1 Tax=Solanum verrucosum TaxID=315347 RepID=A0AAF0UTQ3_SOLVR|nr:hypothetical protein MTR67_044616 [Solanum verrucosum]